MQVDYDDVLVCTCVSGHREVEWLLHKVFVVHVHVRLVSSVPRPPLTFYSGFQSTSFKDIRAVCGFVSFRCKGRGSKASGRGTKHCETDLLSQGAFCRFSDVLKISRLLPSVLCSFLGFSSSHCDSFMWRSIDTFSSLNRGWTRFGVTYRTM